MTLRDKIARIVTLDHIQLLTDYDMDADLYRTDPESLESANATADAILSVIAESVEPLVWDGRQTTGIMFQYRVHIGYGIMNGLFALTLSGSTIGEFDSEESAKAAAQADYTRRILSGIGLSTPEQEKGE